MGTAGRSTVVQRSRTSVGEHFWARGYFVSTLGRDKALIRGCIPTQGERIKWSDQPNLSR